jgi:hypothetical protein
MGDLLYMKIKSGDRAMSIPSNRQPELTDHEGLLAILTQVVAGVGKLEKLSHAINALHAHLPEGPLKSQLASCSRDVLRCIEASNVRLEHIGSSAHSKTDREIP